MVEFLSVLHIIVTVALCGLVLVQDSKGGGALGIGGSGSNSLLGATGAQTLAATMTKWVAVLFAASCIALTYFLAHQNKSVVDQRHSVINTSPIPENSPSTPVTSDTKPATGEQGAMAVDPAAKAPPAATTPTENQPEKK
ncbi:MAG: preprotein translocase subunit SecG [Bdellovibrionaceae bacterium]|nr:preprotein translocase subunit SecG [Pseudobdellovibrionaceae bacterium]